MVEKLIKEDTLYEEESFRAAYDLKAITGVDGLWGMAPKDYIFDPKGKLEGPLTHES